MAESVVIQPDTKFIREVMASGGGDLKKCMQCATCSVVCSQSPADAPFPRRQMAAAQWGLKEQVVADPALWLCHNCGDCSTYCPRGAKPGEVLGALRAQAIKYFAFPRFMGELVSQPGKLPLLFLIPALIILLVGGVFAQDHDAGAGIRESCSRSRYWRRCFSPYRVWLYWCSP